MIGPVLLKLGSLLIIIVYDLNTIYGVHYALNIRVWMFFIHTYIFAYNSKSNLVFQTLNFNINGKQK